MPGDVTDLTMPRADGEQRLEEADGEQRLEATQDQSGGRTRFSMVPMLSESFNAVETLGEKFPDPGPSLWSVLFHAIMHKPLLIIPPSLCGAFVMYVMALFPHCAITEEEVPLAGALGLGRWEEWICSRAFVRSVRRIVVFLFFLALRQIPRKSELFLKCP